MQWQRPDTDASGTEWVTTRVAAAALGVKQRRVRDYISEGILEAKTEGDGTNRRYFVSAAGVEALRASLHAEGKLPGQNRKVTDEARRFRHDDLAEKSAELVRDLAAELSEARYRLGKAESRLELAARDESALKKQLQHERERVVRLEAERDRLLPDLLRERDITTAQRERAEHFEAELREALEARRGWFRRFFGF